MAKSSRAGEWEVGRSIRTWQRAYEAAAKRDGYRTLLRQLDHDEGEPPAKGEELAAGLVEVVTYVLALRGIDGQLTETETEAFLAAQKYGVQPSAGLAVRLGPMPEVRVFVNDLGDLDFEDLFNRFVFYNICVTTLQGEFTGAAAESVVEQVREDLGYGGDEYEIEWAHGGDWVTIHATEID